jgi:hypothetical protein
MKLTIAFFSIILTLSFGACSSVTVPTKEVTFTPCCATHEPDKVVLLEDPLAPGGTVVRLVH